MSTSLCVFQVLDFDKCPAIEGYSTYVITIGALALVGTFLRFLAGSTATENMQSMNLKEFPVAVKFGTQFAELCVAIWGATLVFPNTQYFSSDGPISNVTTTKGISVDECQGSLYLMGFVRRPCLEFARKLAELRLPGTHGGACDRDRSTRSCRLPSTHP